MRETGIFTGTTSSLCLSLRQLPDRYAIRAGRNFMSFHSFLWHRLYVHLIAANLEFRYQYIFACPMDSSPSLTEQSLRDHRARDADRHSPTRRFLRTFQSQLSSMTAMGTPGSVAAPSLPTH